MNGVYFKLYYILVQKSLGGAGLWCVELTSFTIYVVWTVRNKPQFLEKSHDLPTRDPTTKTTAVEIMFQPCLPGRW